MADEELIRTIVREYLKGLLRSRAAVHRIMACVADICERDEQLARALAEHPEALAALSRAVRPAGWLLRAAGVPARKTPAAAAKISAARRIRKGRRRKH